MEKHCAQRNGQKSQVSVRTQSIFGTQDSVESLPRIRHLKYGIGEKKMATLENIFICLCYGILILMALAACVGVIAVIVWGIALLIKEWRADDGK